jgi:hypothetical protein
MQGVFGATVPAATANLGKLCTCGVLCSTPAIFGVVFVGCLRCFHRGRARRMGKLVQMNVLIVGLRGVGVEIGESRDGGEKGGGGGGGPGGGGPPLVCRVAHCFSLTRAYRRAAKCLILAGPKSVTLYDPEPVTLLDVGTNVRTTGCAFHAAVTPSHRPPASTRVRAVLLQPQQRGRPPRRHLRGPAVGAEPLRLRVRRRWHARRTGAG